MRWTRRHTQLALRSLVAVGSIVIVLVGLVTGDDRLLAIGGPGLGWAIPWLREVELDRELNRALVDLEHGEPSRNVERRLRRVSSAPPREPQ